MLWTCTFESRHCTCMCQLMACVKRTLREVYDVVQTSGMPCRVFTLPGGVEAHGFGGQQTGGGQSVGNSAPFPECATPICIPDLYVYLVGARTRHAYVHACKQEPAAVHMPRMPRMCAHLCFNLGSALGDWHVQQLVCSGSLTAALAYV